MTLPANTVWEIRSDGDDSNGGAFVSGGSGTDYSQSSSPHLTRTDFTSSGAGSGDIVSSTGGFTSDLVDNIIRLTGGTNLTEGWYRISSVVNSTTLRLDRAPDNGDGGISGVTGKIGGAIKSLGAFGKAFSDSAVGPHWVWVKSGNYTLSNSTTNTPGGPCNLVTKYCHIEGYGTTRGDLGTPPVISAGSQTSLTILNSDSSYNRKKHFIRNLVLDGNSQTGVYAFGDNGSQYRQTFCDMLELKNCAGDAVYGGGNTIWSRSCGHGNSGVGLTGYMLFGCKAYSNGGQGIKQNTVQGGMFCCISYNNTGDGFGVASYGANYVQCVAYGNGGDGFDWGSGTYSMSSAFHCVAVNNGGYGFRRPSLYTDGLIYRCAGYGNTSGFKPDSVDIGVIDQITLSGNPFVDAANGDFSLKLSSAAGRQLWREGLLVWGEEEIKRHMLNAIPHSVPPRALRTAV